MFFSIDQKHEPLKMYLCTTLCFPGGVDGKEVACNAGDSSLIPGSGRFCWRREWLPTPVVVP